MEVSGSGRDVCQREICSRVHTGLRMNSNFLSGLSCFEFWRNQFSRVRTGWQINDFLLGLGWVACHQKLFCHDRICSLFGVYFFSILGRVACWLQVEFLGTNKTEFNESYFNTFVSECGLKEFFSVFMSDRNCHHMEFLGSGQVMWRRNLFRGVQIGLRFDEIYL